MASFRVCLVTLWVLGCGTEAAPPSSYAEAMDRAIGRGLPGLIVYVQRGDEVAFEGVAGVANREDGVAMRADHVFRIASNSKTMLGVLAAMLVDEGRLDLDARAAVYLPAELVAEIENLETATIRQLLQHTSGIYDYLDDAFWREVLRNPGRDWTTLDALSYAFGRRASFSPGRRFEYSNSNYLLAGLVIDSVMQEPHSQLMRRRIFSPLSLTATTYEVQEPTRGVLARGYADVVGGPALEDMTDWQQGYGLADGGVIASAADLAAFFRALGQGRWLSPGARSALFDTAVKADAEEDYGLGIGISRRPPSRLSHGGEVAGYVSEVFHYPDLDVTVVVFANGTDGSLTSAFDSLVADILDLTLRSR